MFLKRPRVYLIFLLLSVLFLSGCWSRREIEELALVMAVAADTEGDRDIRLSVFIVNPREIGGGQPSGAGAGGGTNKVPGEIVSTTGSDFTEAARRIEEQVPRRLFWAHNRVIIVGDKLARRGLNWLDWFSRDRQMRLTTPVILAPGEARQVLDLPPGVELIPGEIISGILNNHVTLKVELKELLSMWQAKGDNPVLPRVTLVSAQEHSGSKTQGAGGRNPEGQGGAGGGEGRTQQKAGPAAIRFDGAGVFRKEKLIGYLNHLETLGTMWLRGEVKEGVLTFNCPEHPGGQVSVRFHRSQTKVIPQVEGDKITFLVKIKSEGDLIEQTCQESLVAVEKIEELEKALYHELDKRVQAALKKAQRELKTDIFGFGEVLHRENPRFWRKVEDNWNEVFTGVEVKLEAQVSIRRIGMSYNPAGGGGRNTGGKMVSPGGR
ncbi:spore germination protein KC [Thermanaeromonas toyohensis ToBE]|uniref:Spore germination protein KC n=1 Tax=Thermanaeromonas toyohensis ToBE TaxID=698762 RepID=A0A1W1W2T5_9FIRM|nr:Ger(x)C family spore germination protein [Thermanaeromonas toyohensis]SMB99813.1 spore germination protein KC [Thermanaeromonas toyohensis ToBE]